MRTLTHVPLAMAVVLILGLLLACALIVWVAVAIRTRLGRTARPASTTCDCSAYPWLDGRHDVWCKADPTDIALDGPGTGDLAQLDYLEAWRQAGCPAVWPIPVVHGRTEGEQS